MTSEMGEIFKAWDEHKKAKKADNLAQSTQILTERGIPFTSHNNGVHLVVDSCFDFWPSTGKWIERETGKKGRGVFNLLKHFKEAP